MAYRDNSSCPRCRASLRAQENGGGLACDRCEGLWVEEADLRKRWTAAIADAVAMPPLTARVDHERRLSCPTCASMMEKVMLEAVELDRCAEHGIWLDRNELERVLSTAVLLSSPPPPAPLPPS